MKSRACILLFAPLLVSTLTAPPALARTGGAAIALPAEGSLTLDQLRARYGDATSRYVSISDVDIHYKDEGEGQVIVLMHGSHSSLDGWDGVAADLARDHRVIRFDMPGMGLSGDAPADTTLPFGDMLLERLLQTLGVTDPIILAGTSSGGSIGYHYAARNPDKVTALILANVPADRVDSATVPRSPALHAVRAEAARTGFRDRQYWATYLPWLAGDPQRYDAGWIDRYYDMNRREASGGATPWRYTSDQAATQAALSAVRTPTLLVWGLRDDVLPLPSMGALRERLGNALVSEIIMADVGHYPPFEVPERFARILRTYVETAVLPVHDAPPWQSSAPQTAR